MFYHEIIALSKLARGNFNVISISPKVDIWGDYCYQAHLFESKFSQITEI